MSYHWSTNIIGFRIITRFYRKEGKEKGERKRDKDKEKKKKIKENKKENQWEVTLDAV